MLLQRRWLICIENARGKRLSAACAVSFSDNQDPINFIVLEDALQRNGGSAIINTQNLSAWFAERTLPEEHLAIDIVLQVVGQRQKKIERDR